MVNKLPEEFEKSSKKMEKGFRLNVKIFEDKKKLKLAYVLKLNESMNKQNEDLDALLLSKKEELGIQEALNSKLKIENSTLCSLIEDLKKKHRNSPC